MLDLHAGDHLPSKPFEPLRHYGLTTGTEAVDRGRDSMFAAQWVDGSEIWELGLSDLRIRARYSTHDTGSFGVAVDEEYGRLILSGLWGVNVLDLQTGQVLARKRLGPGVRIAQIDRHHGLIYLGTTFGSHVWVLDRRPRRWAEYDGLLHVRVAADGRFFSRPAQPAPATRLRRWRTPHAAAELLRRDATAAAVGGRRCIEVIRAHTLDSARCDGGEPRLRNNGIPCLLETNS